MLTVSGTNTNAALPHRHIDNRAGSRWHAAHGWLAVLIDNAESPARSLCAGALVRLSPDSARTKNTMANVVASQQVSRAAAFDRFIVLLLLLRAERLRDFGFRCELDAGPSAGRSPIRRCGRDAAQGRRRNASKFFMLKAAENTNPWQKE